MNKEIKQLIGRCQRLDAFIEQRPALWEQPIIQQFMKNPHHRSLVIAAICHPTRYNKDKVDQSFYAFYGEIKLTSYMMKTLHWRAVRFDQQFQQKNSKHPLILDQPLASDKSTTLADSLSHADTSIVDKITDKSRNLKDMLSEKSLYLAFNHLTARQEIILEKSYKDGWSDIEMAHALSISQQAVFKTRQKALDKIRVYIKRWDSD
ncbi:hypothetical protein D7Z54_26600 [Salibacterium salarium]|uniref:RNA polymerase sigma factor, sigma-70 family n=1 Tax=Salibacterium salarium TaxID=284579 RepID=A0A3R9P3J6_9BACI|nr:sigma-70 family RNA polymerase sigma factor [Salibacterium salarium]RSL30288.1 hypothetical protein D7Z54_26600 [Salibacterium salarium]